MSLFYEFNLCDLYNDSSSHVFEEHRDHHFKMVIRVLLNRLNSLQFFSQDGPYNLPEEADPYF